MRVSVLGVIGLAGLLACSGAGGDVEAGVLWTDGGPDVEPPKDKDASSAEADAGQPEIDIDAIPWDSGPSVGFGVSTKDTGNPLGTNAFIAYAGYDVDLAAAQAWATALYRATLRARGVRWVWAVQGPNNPAYSNLEIGNSKIVAALLPKVGPSTRFVLAVGHSSGSFVAHELLGQLEGGLDPNGVTANRVVYFDLDGGQSGLSGPIVGRLKRAYFAASRDGATWSPNAQAMKSLGATYAGAGGYYENDASGSGCNAGATWCVHVTLITTKPTTRPRPWRSRTTAISTDAP
jgi:hypothetical protein